MTADKTITRIYRQGDVILAQLAVNPPGLATDGHPQQDLVLALGEATGHAHRLRGTVEVLEPDRGDGRIVFRVVEPVVLTHDEHGPMVLDPGLYTKVDQVEYDPYAEELRRIAD